MRIQVRLFALARDLAGGETLEVELPAGARLADLKQALCAARPELESLVRHAAFAVDAEYASDATQLAADSDVACIPPVSGG